MTSRPFWWWILGMFLVALLTVPPYFYYRQSYSHAKRLRVVTAGKVYRSGSMTAEGFREAIRRFDIKTVLNLQEEAQDPNLPESYFDRSTVRESELTQELGARMIFLDVGLVHPEHAKTQRPPTIDRFLALMDDPNNYPILIHCRAGLHRTGVITAVYRMEYEGWSPEAALRELKAHGFGEFASSSANMYVQQYVLSYQPRPPERNPLTVRGRQNLPAHLTSRPVKP